MFMLCTEMMQIGSLQSQVIHITSYAFHVIHFFGQIRFKLEAVYWFGTCTNLIYIWDLLVLAILLFISTLNIATTTVPSIIFLFKSRLTDWILRAISYIDMLEMMMPGSVTASSTY